jgi:hypothetical protein
MEMKIKTRRLFFFKRNNFTYYIYISFNGKYNSPEIYEAMNFFKYKDMTGKYLSDFIMEKVKKL